MHNTQRLLKSGATELYDQQSQHRSNVQQKNSQHRRADLLVREENIKHKVGQSIR